jgi:hypothetical protein
MSKSREEIVRPGVPDASGPAAPEGSGITFFEIDGSGSVADGMDAYVAPPPEPLVGDPPPPPTRGPSGPPPPLTGDREATRHPWTFPDWMLHGGAAPPSKYDEPVDRETLRDLLRDLRGVLRDLLGPRDGPLPTDSGDAGLDIPAIAVPDAATGTHSSDGAAPSRADPPPPPRPNTQEKAGTGMPETRSDRPRTRERPGTGAKDPQRLEPERPQRPTGQITDETGEYGPERTWDPGKTDWSKMNRVGPRAIAGGIAGLLTGAIVFGSFPRSESPIAASVASPAPVATALAAATRRPSPTIAVYRISGLPAEYSGGPKCSQMWVTFRWMIEGLGATGNYVIRYSSGEGYGPENGPMAIPSRFDALTWDPATGLLTLRHPVGVYQTAKAAQITKILSTLVTGNGESSAPLAPCTPG